MMVRAFPVSGICRLAAFARPGYRADVTSCMFLQARCHIGTHRTGGRRAGGGDHGGDMRIKGGPRPAGLIQLANLTCWGTSPHPDHPRRATQDTARPDLTKTHVMINPRPVGLISPLCSER